MSYMRRLQEIPKGLWFWVYGHLPPKTDVEPKGREWWLPENNQWIDSFHRRVHKKIRETNADKRLPHENEDNCPTCLPQGERTHHLTCCECYGYGILHRTRRQGPNEWWTCDFCGWVEPTGNMLWGGSQERNFG